MHLRNYTTHHPLRLYASSGTPITLARGETVKLGAHRVAVAPPRAGACVDGLPAPRPGVVLLVEEDVALALPWREDLLVPELVRDRRGVPVAANRLYRPAVCAAVQGLLARSTHAGIVVACSACGLDHVMPVEEDCDDAELERRLASVICAQCAMGALVKGWDAADEAAWAAADEDAAADETVGDDQDADAS